MIEVYSSEPNLMKFTTDVQGRYVSPDRISASLKASNELGSHTPLIDLRIDELDNGRYEYIIPQQLVEGKKYAEVFIEYELEEYGVFRDHKTFEIAQRLIGFNELNTALGEFGIEEYDTFSEIERNVRHIIQSHCNQNFNWWTGEQSVRGAGAVLQLPDRLAKLEGVATHSSAFSNPLQTFPEQGYVIDGDGYILFNSYKQDTLNMFRHKPRTTTYVVKGDWGYQSVPTAIRQAAIELCKGFLCEDIEYRRRYLDNIRTGDVRIQFNAQAYINSTGNPIADTLLAPYVRILYGVL